jgi:hypothetical protein
MTRLARRILIFEYDRALLAFRFLNIISLCFLVKERTSFSKICASSHTTPLLQYESANEDNAFLLEWIQSVKNSVTMLTPASKESLIGDTLPVTLISTVLFGTRDSVRLRAWPKEQDKTRTVVPLSCRYDQPSQLSSSPG